MKQMLCTRTSCAATPLVILFAFGVLGSGNLFAQTCYPGSVVKEISSNNTVGCAFTSWGPDEKAMCGTRKVFGGPNPNSGHICLDTKYEADLANEQFAALKLKLKLVPSSNSTPWKTPLNIASLLKAAFAPPALVAWWKLEEPGSFDPVLDATKLVPDGTRVATLSLPGIVGNANEFDGITSYISVPHNSLLDVSTSDKGSIGDFSIAAWVKRSDLPLDSAGVQVLVEKRKVTGTFKDYRGYSFALYNGRLLLQLADGVGNDGYTNYGSLLTVPQDGNWHFVAVSVERLNPLGIRFSLDNKPGDFQIV